MGRLPKVRSDYLKLAAERDLSFIGITTPSSIKDTTKWKCKRCGRVISKSYDNTRQHPGCICWSKSLQRSDYDSLGKRLGITCEALEFVSTISSPVMWKSNTLGVYFKASYRELAYGRIPKRLLIYVNEMFEPQSDPQEEPESF